MSERITPEAFIAALIRDGVIAANAAPLPAQPEQRPWFVSALQGIAGWLAGIFTLIFIGVAFEPHGAASFIIFAALLLPAAFALYISAQNNTFLDQLALAASMAGQISATIGFATGMHDSLSISAACVAVMQCALVILMPNPLARSIAAFFACVAWSLTIRFAWWGEVESWDAAQHPVSLIAALIGWLVIWIPVAVGCIVAIVEEARWTGQPAARIIRPALSGMLLALTCGTFASEPLDAFGWMLTSRPAAQNWLVLWPLLNAAAALLAGFGAFQLRNKALLGIAVAAALLHIGQFYFLLGTSLVVKSIIMVAVGTVLLGWGLFLGRRSTAPGEVAP
jgi:uncharacterized protein DUF4401